MANPIAARHVKGILRKFRGQVKKQKKALNLFAVPLLALAGRWELAAGLMIAERAGKAIQTPARDAMLSHAMATIGHGWGFGLHEAPTARLQ